MTHRRIGPIRQVKLTVRDIDGSNLCVTRAGKHELSQDSRLPILEVGNWTGIQQAGS
ncbi:hypothetical protein HNQ59_001718 [Chitinivorax tropicus]|uniref:Uncharacterized protein n=1 Tax=Chitinivorax tropicus TaxID=714531 RepID=A0A840MMT7_9PROT|nr:hypothetical protein [Chitinivorax tropicus]MBB5018429.1 hypothetical protein [Chitinivorax tropicus]